MKSLKFFKPAPATTVAIGSWRLVLLLTTAVSLIGYPKPASGSTVVVTAEGLYGDWFFAPSPVTIHPGDQVQWTWFTGNHSTTSGRPGMPDGIWDSGVRGRGATFTHTFNSEGTFPYYCSVHGEVGTVIVTSATTPTMTNISTRTNVGTGENVLIGGIIISGSDPATVVFRALGPSLAAFGVTGALDNPTIELHDSSGAEIATNFDWKENSAEDQTVLTNNGLAPTDDFESALVMTLDPGAYTAIVSGENDGTGVSLVEAYNLSSDTADSKFANISTRGNVGTGQNVMIGGFILGGGAGGFSEVIVRGIGPSLADSGVTDPLANPFLELHDSEGTVIASNDNWMDDPNMAAVVDRGLAPTDPNESALYQVLLNGAYTVILSGVGDTTGVGLVESYDVSVSITSASK